MLLAAVLDAAAPGEEVDVSVASRAVALELHGWARLAGHAVVDDRAEGSRRLVRVRRGGSRRVLAEPLPAPAPPARLRPDGFRTSDWRGEAVPLPERADGAAGFVPLASVAEAGGPAYAWTLNRREQVWSDDVGRLVEGASGAQWDASRDVPWSEATGLPDHLERAVCQVSTYLAQNEHAALALPARFLDQVNPAYVEVLLWLASHVHDEARHVEVFTKRALVNGGSAYALASTQRSLHALLQERNFTATALLLNVLGEGSFIDLLEFVAEHAPDAAMATAARLAHRDELRHVHFGLSHLRHVLGRDPSAASGLVAAVEARAAQLAGMTGLDPLVMESLTIMAGGSLQPAQLSEGAAAVRALMTRMAGNRVGRLLAAGLDERTARYISDLHTPNLM